MRPKLPQLDMIIGKEFPCLNHGHVRLIDYMGDDAAIVQAARVSYGDGTKTVNEDIGLINYLMRHRHTTPFEMCEIKLHMKMPIFVARQLIRHRTANVNEVSARYSILPNEFYIPQPENLGVQSKVNRQGRGDMLSPEESQRIIDIIRTESEMSFRNYSDCLNDIGDGTPIDPEIPMLARELARMNLSLNFYTEWYWKIDLHNLLHFLGLRDDPHAQYEIRVYAKAITEIVQQWCPHAYEAWVEHRHHAYTLSRTALRALAPAMWANEQYLRGKIPKREWEDLLAAIKRVEK